MRHAALEVLALPAKLAVSAAVFVTLATVSAEFVASAHGPALAGSRTRLPRSIHDLALLKDGRYAVIRFPRRLVVGEAGVEFPTDFASRPGGLPQALAGPTPDGRILVGDADGTVDVWTPAGSKPETRFLGRHDGPADLLCLSPDGRQAAAATGSAAAEPRSPVTVWDLASGAVAARFDVPGPVDWIGFCDDSQSLVTRGEDGMLSAWRAAGGDHLGTIRCGAAGKGTAACSPASPLVAWCGPARAGGRRLAVQVSNLSSDKRLWESTIELANDVAPYYVPRLAFSGDGALLACGTADAVILFDASDGRRLAEAAAPWHRVAALRFAADGRNVVSAGADGTVRWWGVPGLSERHRAEDFLSD